MWSLLSDSRIRTVWIAETINALGSGLSFWALAWFLYRRAPEAPWLAGAVLAARGIGALLGAIGLGSFLDYWDRRRTLVTVNLLLAALTMLLPSLISSPAVFFVIASFVIGVLGSVSQPALSASLPSFVSLERTHQIQALFNLTWMSAEFFAPVLAGVLIARISAGNVFYLDALSFLIVAGAYLLIRFPAQAKPQPSRANVFGDWWHQVQSGWAFVARKPILWGTMLGLASVNGLFEAYSGLFLPRVSDALTRGVRFPTWLGSDTGALGLGLFDTVVILLETLGSIWIASRAMPSNLVALRLLLLGCFGPMLGMLTVVLAPNIAIALIGCALQGASIATISTIWPALFAQVVPEELRGRANSVRFFIGNTARPIITALSGILLVPFGVLNLMIVLVTVFSCVSLGGFLIASRSLRGDRMQEA
jgi:MFS family permease